MVQLQVQGVVKAAVAAAADGAVLLHQDGKHLVAGEFGAGGFGEADTDFEIGGRGFVVVATHRRGLGVKNIATAGQVAVIVDVKADFVQPLQNGLVGFVPDVDADPFSAQDFGGNGRSSAPGKRVKHPIAGVAAGGDDALVEFERFLRRIAGTFRPPAGQVRNIRPQIRCRLAGRQIPFAIRAAAA